MGSNKKLYLLLAAFVVIACVVTVVIAWFGSDAVGLGGSTSSRHQEHHHHHRDEPTTTTTPTTTTPPTTPPTPDSDEDVDGIGVFADTDRFSLHFPSAPQPPHHHPQHPHHPDMFGAHLQRLRFPDMPEPYHSQELSGSSSTSSEEHQQHPQPSWHPGPMTAPTNWIPNSKLEDLEAISYEFKELYELAGRIYNSSENITDFSSFVRILNETVNDHDKAGLLAKLNRIYTRPEVNPDPSNVLMSGKSAYETSLTAFVFLSFGIFLMNQMHTILGKKHHGGHQQYSEGRKMNSDPVVEALDALFYPPDHFKGHNASDHGEAAEGRYSGSYDDGQQDNQVNSTGYVNNMFRAFLNLINAYMKDEFVLECIWALYCKDLDNTAAKEGLYGVAARVNSIGLRLIMQQIPTELTMNMLIRSLLGWDGLPCDRMFPRCSPNDADDVLREAAIAEEL